MCSRVIEFEQKNSFQMRHILYNIQNAPVVLEGAMKQLKIHQAISLHPVKNSLHIYKLHHFLQVATYIQSLDFHLF